MAGFCAVSQDQSAETALDGWRRSADGTLLCPFSLLTGNLTGNFAKKRLLARQSLEIVALAWALDANSLLNETGNYFIGAGNSGAGTGNLSCQNRNHRGMRFSVQTRGAAPTIILEGNLTTI
jgi:hypothetical protein